MAVLKNLLKVKREVNSVGFMANVKDKMTDKMLGMSKEKQVTMMRDMTAMLLNGLTKDEKAGFLNAVTLDMVKGLPPDVVKEILG